MARLPTVKIKHPWGGDGYVIVNERDFDPAVHTRWGEKPSAPPADEPDTPTLPDGYRAKHRGGGKYAALVDGQPLRNAESDEVVKFGSRDDAEAALRRYAEAQDV